MGRVKEQLEEYYSQPSRTASLSQNKYSKIEDEAPPSILVEVILRMHKSLNGDLVRCIFLRFEDSGLPERKMYLKFDPDGRILLKASTLLGELVQTRVWRPEVYNPIEWFQDLYKAKSDNRLHNAPHPQIQSENATDLENIKLVNKAPAQRVAANQYRKSLIISNSPQPIANKELQNSPIADTSNNATSIQALLTKYPKRTKKYLK